jgi:hypothetical protein
MDCIIIAGGPSLCNFDWDRLSNYKQDIFAINRAYEYAPMASHLFWVDERFFLAHEEGLKKHEARHKITALRKPMRVDYDSKGWVETVQFSGQRGYDERLGFIKTGNNSTYALLNLVCQRGYDKVYLLGLDMQYDACGRSHFHSGHSYVDGRPIAHKESTLTDKMLPFFDEFKEATKHLDTKIINCNLNSAVRCFEFGVLPI